MTRDRKPSPNGSARPAWMPGEQGAVRAAHRREARTCPRCGSADSVRIVYGLPDPQSDLVERAERGEVALGGCLVDEDDPTRACRRCDHRWRPPGERSWY